MRLEIFKVIFTTVFLFSTAFVTIVQAAATEGGEPPQSPTQVIVQIFVTTVVLRFLQYFDLP